MSKFAYWNYRVLKETHTIGADTETECRIIECYYDKKDRIVAWGEASARGETVQELYEELGRMESRAGLAMLSKADKRALTLADLPASLPTGEQTP